MADNLGPTPGATNTSVTTQTPVTEVYGTPGDGKVVQWNTTTGRLEWGTAPSAAYAGLTPTGQQQLATQRSTLLRPFHAALAARNAARCSLLMVGDSFTLGQGATAHTKTTPARLAALLRSRFPQTVTGGRGYINAYNSGQESTYTYPCTLSGTVGINGGNNTGFGINPYVTLAAAGQTATYALQGTSADIVYVQGSSTGVLTWQVDGGTVNTFATSGGSTVDGKLLRVSLGASGAHTLVVGWSSGGTIFHEGVIEYDGDETAGIMVHNVGRSGSKTADWSSVLTSANGGKVVAALAPNLIVVALGLNDLGTGASVATMQANLTTLIATLRASLTTPYPTIILDAVWGRGDSTFNAASWAPYVAGMQAVADADGAILLFDETLRFANPADTFTYGMLFDTLHPNDKGHQARADALAAYLAPV